MRVLYGCHRVPALPASGRHYRTDWGLPASGRHYRWIGMAAVPVGEGYGAAAAMHRQSGGEVEHHAAFDGARVHAREHVVDVFQAVGADRGCDLAFGGELQ